MKVFTFHYIVLITDRIAKPGCLWLFVGFALYFLQIF